MGRIGRFRTKSGLIETPLLFPVINPSLQPIKPDILEKDYGCKSLITNAYIINNNFKEIAIKEGLHKFLNFKGSIMTDSGAYQLLIYKGVETTPEEIVRFQEAIDTDIATILDIPTGWGVTKKYAKYTVDETIKRAKDLDNLTTRDDLLWVGPVQGGKYLDLIAKSAKEMGKLSSFQIHALGSPTPIMEQYNFEILVDMIITAKMNLPADRPLHLFGAGHPIMFALAVALGCDLFDSAAYALFAREGRYLTESGTIRFDSMDYFPCSCPSCNNKDPETVRNLPINEIQKLLAEHNLYASFSELRRIKQAIHEGRLWELLELRAYSHPSLLKALKKIVKYSDFLEKYSPVTKKSGIFFFNSLGLGRPEIIRYQQRLNCNFSKPKEAKILVLFPQTKKKPFHNSQEQQHIIRKIKEILKNKIQIVHFCTYAAPFGIIPIELDDVYPISQNVIEPPYDYETINYVIKQVTHFILNRNYKHVILLNDPYTWNDNVVLACKEACEIKNILFLTSEEKDPWSKNNITKLIDQIKVGTQTL